MLGIVVFCPADRVFKPGRWHFSSDFFQVFLQGIKVSKDQQSTTGRHMVSVSGWISGQIGPSWSPWSLTWPPWPLVVTQGVDSQDMSWGTCFFYFCFLLTLIMCIILALWHVSYLRYWMYITYVETCFLLVFLLRFLLVLDNMCLTCVIICKLLVF